MKYWIVDNNERFDDVNDVLNHIIYEDYYDDEEAISEWIDDVYSDSHVTIGGVSFSPSEIVKACDDILWSELTSQYQECQVESDQDYYYSEVDHMGDGDSVRINGFDIECFEEEDEEEDEDDNDDEDKAFPFDLEEENEETDEEEEIVIKTLMDYFQTIK